MKEDIEQLYAIHQECTIKYPFSVKLERDFNSTTIISLHGELTTKQTHSLERTTGQNKRGHQIFFNPRGSPV
jgi:hypothetical protein